MSISQSVSGYGTSGVVTATMTFTANNRYYVGFDFDPYDIPSNAEVRLVCGGAAIAPPLFYVTGRKKRGGVTDWTCCDIVSKTDRLIEFSDSDFDENDKITVSDMLVKIHDQCGIGVNTGGLSMLINKTFDKSLCEDGVTARRILEILAEAMCGYWLAVDGAVVVQGHRVSNYLHSITKATVVLYVDKTFVFIGNIAKLFSIRITVAAFVYFKLYTEVTFPFAIEYRVRLETIIVNIFA